VDSDSSDLEPHVTADNAVHELEQQLDQQHISKEDSNSEHEHGTQGDTSPPTMEVNINNQEVGQQDTTDRTIAIEEATDEYLLKEIDWINPSTGAEKRVKIITQNSTSLERTHNASRINHYIYKSTSDPLFRKRAMSFSSHR
jgi:hypothetical protein